MTSFDGFKEVTLLYAENHKLVEQVRSECFSDINRFLDCVKETVREMDLPAPLCEKTTQGYRYWWLASDDHQNQRLPQLWLYSSDPELVSGTMKLTAIWDGAERNEISALAEIRSDPAVEDICRTGDGGTWSILKAEIKVPKNDPVAPVAAKVGLLLSKLYITHELIRGSNEC